MCSCQNEHGATLVYAEKDVQDVTLVSVHKSELELKTNLGIMYYESQPFSGTSLQFYNQDKIAESISYLNGKRHGVYKKWFPNGILSYEAFFTDGLQHGKTKTWWKNGNLRSESNYVKGVANGIQRQWYKSGAKFKEMTLVNGKEEGIQKAWRENGKIYNNYEAKNGRIFGLKRANLCYQLEDENVQY